MAMGRLGWAIPHFAANVVVGVSSFADGCVGDLAVDNDRFAEHCLGLSVGWCFFVDANHASSWWIGKSIGSTTAEG